MTEAEPKIAKRPPAAVPEKLEDSRLLDVFEVATVLGFSAQHVRRLYRVGRLPAPVRPGGRGVRWPLWQVREMTEGRTAG